MSIEKAKATDIVGGGLIANTGASEGAKATGKYTVECYDKDGNLKWVAETPNLVVNVGLQYMAGTALTSTSEITSWYLGLYGAASSNNPAAGDTMSSHAGWTEVTTYSESTRPAATFAAASVGDKRRSACCRTRGTTRTSGTMIRTRLLPPETMRRLRQQPTR